MNTSKVSAISLETLLILIIKLCQGGKINSPPEIWLKGYWGSGQDQNGVKAHYAFRMAHMFQTSLISKSGTDYTIKNVSGVAFVCQGSAPVEWAVSERKHLPPLPTFLIATEAERISKFLNASAQEEPENKQFLSTLSVSNISGFFSVGFTCRYINHTEKPSLRQDRLHLYILPQNSSAALPLENMRKEVNVSCPSFESNDSSPSPIVVPCRPSLPKATVLLEKKHNFDWKPVSSKGYSFDPRVGFTLPRNESELGTYWCSLKSTPLENGTFTIVNLAVTTTEPREINFEPHTLLKRSAEVIPVDSTGILKCCPGPDDGGVKVRARQCLHGRLECDILKHHPDFNGEIDSIERYEYAVPSVDKCSHIDTKKLRSGVVDCQGFDIDYRGEFVELFRPAAGSITKRIEELGLLKSLSEEALRLTEYDDIGSGKNFTVERKMVILVGHNGTGESERSWVLVGGNPISRLHLNITINKNQTEFIDEYGRNFYYDGEALRFVCFGLKYFYDGGGYMTLNWKNGTKKILHRGSVQTPRNFSLYSGTSKKIEIFSGPENIVAEFSNEIKASTEMESVECLMPVENSEKWEKLTYPIEVLPSVPPKFTGEEIEEVHFRGGEQSRNIICEVLEGIPIPSVNVTKNGQLYQTHPRDPNNYGNKTEIKLDLDMSAVPAGRTMFQCVVENAIGKVVKTIHVLVTE